MYDCFAIHYIDEITSSNSFGYLYGAIQYAHVTHARVLYEIKKNQFNLKLKIRSLRQHFELYIQRWLNKLHRAVVYDPKCCTTDTVHFN